jgi:hypothetical protein
MIGGSWDALPGNKRFWQTFPSPVTAPEGVIDRRTRIVHPKCRNLPTKLPIGFIRLREIFQSLHHTPASTLVA